MGVIAKKPLFPDKKYFDQGEKLRAYGSFTVLKNYPYIEPEYYHVTLFFKDETGFRQSDTFRKLNQLISGFELDLVITLSSIYEGVSCD